MSPCVFDRRACLDGHEDDLAAAAESFSILGCLDKKAIGFEDKVCADELQGIDIGVRLAEAPMGISSLAFLGANSPFADIVAVDKNVIVFTVSFPGDFGRVSYLIYDAVARSLRLIPMPGDQSWSFSLSARVLIARPGPAHESDDYALVHIGKQQQQDSLILWRPSSTPSPPWSECKKASFSGVDERYQTDLEFSFDGHCYWVDLLCGVLYCKCDALFRKNSDEVITFGLISLPVKHEGQHRTSGCVAQPEAYRTMGVVQNSIKFVSMDGFLEHVHLKDRKVTVWGLQGPDSQWEVERELRLETLWGFMDAGNMLRHLTPMCPLLCPDDENIIYLMLDEYQEKRSLWEFVPGVGHHLLAVDIQNAGILNSIRLEDSSSSLDLVSCDCSQYLRDAQRVSSDDGDNYAVVPMKKHRSC